MAECTTSQVRLDIDIWVWVERREAEMESHKQEIVDRRVIALKTEKIS